MDVSIVLALVGVAFAVAMGAVGSCYGVGSVAKVGASLLSKEAEKFPQVLALSALPSTQALYGLLFGFVVLIQIGLLGGTPEVFSQNVGWMYFLSAIPVGVACLFSGIAQGAAAAAGVKILAQKPENFSQAVVLSSLIESFAIFGLVISLLIVFVGIPAVV